MSTTTHSLVSHSCDANYCTGQNFNGLHVKCSQCGSKTFFECIKSRNGVDELLKLLNVITSENDTSLNNTHSAQKSINSIFDHNSFFAIRCDNCRASTNNNEIKRLNTELNEERKKYNELCVKLSHLASSVNSTSNTTSTAIDTSNIPPANNETSNTTQKLVDTDVIQQDNHDNGIRVSDQARAQGTDRKNENTVVLPIRDENGLYPIFVKTTNKLVKTDGLTKLISQRAGIDPSAFKVLHLTKNQRRSYVSFKVITLNDQVFEKIVNKENWSEGYSVRAFDSRDSQLKANQTENSVHNAHTQPAEPKNRRYGQTNDQNRRNKGQSDQNDNKNQRQFHENDRRYNDTNANDRFESRKRQYENRYGEDTNDSYRNDHRDHRDNRDNRDHRDHRPPRHQRSQQDFYDDDYHFRARPRSRQPHNRRVYDHRDYQTDYYPRHRSYGRGPPAYDTRRYY